MAAKRYYYCADGVNVIGPFTRADTRKLLKAKVIFPDTSVSLGKESDWKAAKFYPELMSAMPGVELPPPLVLRRAATSTQMPPDWHADPPTERQIARLKFLGAKLPANLTKGGASAMLDRLITPENQIAWDKYKLTTIDRVHNRFAAFCYSALPGAGHYQSGAQIAAILWFLVVIVAYIEYPYIGAGLHLLCACNAAARD